MNAKHMRPLLASRWSFLGLLLLLFWAKTLYVYLTDFALGVSGIWQWLILLFNPLASTMLLLSVGFFIRRPKLAYFVTLVLYTLDSLLLIANVIYYREFTDFMTTSVMLGFSSVSDGLSSSSLALLKTPDLLIFADIIIIIVLLLTRVIKIDKRPVKRRNAVALSSFSFLLVVLNITFAECIRPQLFSRNFNRSYIVKYAGLLNFTIYDGMRTIDTNHTRNQADSADLNKIIKFTRKHYASPNKKLFGIAKGKNIIVIHLESFQQFLINYKLNGKEVTPFLNSLYRSKSTYSFANFFNQVGQGKTSDAENMLETSTYGLANGSLFTSLGTDNTFEGAPSILNQTQGYSSAVFHGNVGSFWNRNNVYKNLGYQNFFDATYYSQNSANQTTYGLKDKLLFHDSVKYLEHLQQPFYVKFITVTNHFPYSLDKQNVSFKAANTGDSSVNNYFVTAHYLDQALKEFFAYLKKSGLAKKSIIVLYGDHYGISDSRNLKLAGLLGKAADTWNDYDNLQLQRVPFMINIPGYTHGKIMQTYGGEIDVLPTLLHLVGVNTRKYLQFGTDLFSKDHDQVVAQRNGNFITPTYSYVNGAIYRNSTGQQITHPTSKVQKLIASYKSKVTTELALSDELNSKNLLRYYVPTKYEPVNPEKYNYKNDLGQLVQKEKKLAHKSTSLYDLNHHHTTINWYKSTAPELKTTDKNSAATSSAWSSVKAARQSSSSTSSSASSKATTTK